MRILLVVLAYGCSETAHVEVNCETTNDPSIRCNIDETRGTGEVTACFDVSATCTNGQIVSAPHTCVTVKGGGSEKAIFPRDNLLGIADCRGAKPPTMSLENLTLNGSAVPMSPTRTSK